MSKDDKPTKDRLLPEVRQALDLPKERRIDYARRDLWVPYDAAKEAIKAMEDLLASPRVVRMPCHVVLAASGNGKSTVLEKFKLDHPPSVKENGGGLMPVVKMEMPDKPVEPKFWSNLLSGMKIVHDAASPHAQLKHQAKTLLDMYQTRLLIIDEIHNILQGHPKDQRHFLVVLKGLANDLGLPIVAAGTRDALFALKSDEQLADRFEPLALPRWTLNQTFRKLLATFETMLPLADPSMLDTPAMALPIFDASNGTIGGVAKLLRRATVLAIGTGDACLTPEIIEQAARRPLRGYDGSDL